MVLCTAARRNFATVLSSAISSTSTGSGYKPWKHEPPEKAIAMGCDYKHWAIALRIPGDYPFKEFVAQLSIKTLATILESCEEEAKKKIYNICIRGYHPYTGFGAEIPEELSLRAKTMPHVEWVRPDSYLYPDVKDYGGDLLVDGEVIRRPEFEWNPCRH